MHWLPFALLFLSTYRVSLLKAHDQGRGFFWVVCCPFVLRTKLCGPSARGCLCSDWEITGKLRGDRIGIFTLARAPSFKKPLEPFVVFTEWVPLSVLGFFCAIQAFTIEGKCFDAFVKVSAVFPYQGDDLLRPRLNGTRSCQLALLADAASQRHWHRAFCYRSSPLQMACWGVIAFLTCLPTPQFPALSCQVAAPCSQTSDAVLTEVHISPLAVLHQWCRRWEVRSDGTREEADEDLKYCLHFPRIKKSQSYFLWMWRSARDQFGPLRNHFAKCTW